MIVSRPPPVATGLGSAFADLASSGPCRRHLLSLADLEPIIALHEGNRPGW